MSFHSAALDAGCTRSSSCPPATRAGPPATRSSTSCTACPAVATTYAGNKWLGRRPRRVGKPAILVEPQGARGSDADAEYLNWGPGRNWETTSRATRRTTSTAHFRTIASRDGRALVGLSAGGYGAVILGVHHLDRFSAIESWSGYFHPTDPTGTIALDRGSDADAHAQIASLKAAEARLPTFLAFYVGRGDIALPRRERRSSTRS